MYSFSNPISGKKPKKIAHLHRQTPHRVRPRQIRIHLLPVHPAAVLHRKMTQKRKNDVKKRKDKGSTVKNNLIFIFL